MRATAAPQLDVRVFKRELTPTWLATTAVLAGQRQIDLTRPFTVAYLGSTTGVTPAVIAAAHPDAQVWVWDRRPGPLEATRRLRDAASLSNLVIHERSALPTRPVPSPFDIVVLEGVVDSVPAELRQHVVSWAGEHLRAGGLVALSYRTTVGWIDIVPIQRLVHHLATRGGRDPISAVPESIELLTRLQTGGAGYLAARPSVAGWVADLAAAAPQFVVDEYVERDLVPISHAQIDAELSNQGCVYVGSAELMDDMGVDIPEGVVEMVASAPTRTLRESYSDLAVRRSSRTDVFRLGSSTVPRADEGKILAALELTSVRSLDGALAELLSDDVRSALGTGRLAASKLDRDPDSARTLVRRLLDGGYAHPSSPDAGRAVAAAAVNGLNQAMSKVPDRDRVVALAEIGSAISVDLARDGFVTQRGSS